MRTWACDGTDEQDWRLERRTGGSYKGYYRLVSTLGSETHCLDNDGDYDDNGTVEIQSCVSDSDSNVAHQSFALDAGTGAGYTLSFVDLAVVWATRNVPLKIQNGNVVTKAASETNRNNARSQWMFASAPSAPSFRAVPRSRA